MSTMTDEESAFVAGVLEGEGCFDFNAPAKRKYPKIRMVTTDPDVAYRLQHIVGSGTVFANRQREAHHKPSVTYQITRSSDACEVMRRIRPWMSARRGAKIDELLAGEAS